MNSKNSEKLMCLKSGTKILLLIGEIICCHIVSAQTLSMQNVLDAIEQNNPLLTSYQYKISASNALSEGAKAWMPPRAGVGFDQTPYKIPEGESFFNRTDGSAIFFVEQDIPNPAKQKAKQNYMKSLSGIDSAEANVTRNKIFTEAKTAYIDRYIAEKKLRIIDQEIALLNLMISSDTSVYSVNQSNLSYIYKTRARMHTIEAMRTHEKSAINEATSKLNYLMNNSSSATYKIDSTIPFKNYSLADFDTSAAYISMHRSDILNIDKNISSLKFSNSLVMSAAKPDFSIRYEHMDMFGMPNQFSLMGSVTIPIVPWASKNYKSENLSVQHEIEAMNWEKKNSINEARSYIQQTLLHTIAEYEEVNHYEKEVIPDYKKALQLSLISYRENNLDILSSLMAWDDLLLAQTEYLYHLNQAYKSEINYENAIEKR